MLTLDATAERAALEEITEFYRTGPRDKPSRAWAKGHPSVPEHPRGAEPIEGDEHGVF